MRVDFQGFQGDSEGSCHANRTLLSFVKNKAVHIAIHTHAHTHTQKRNRRTNITSKTREKKKKKIQTLFSVFYKLSLIFGVDHKTLPK